MMGPDYTHWHGTYEVAKHFYVKFIPELEELIEKGEKSEDPKKQDAAKRLQELLDETLAKKDHRWFVNQMDPGEAAARQKAAEEFKQRYK